MLHFEHLVFKMISKVDVSLCSDPKEIFLYYDFVIQRQYINYGETKIVT